VKVHGQDHPTVATTQNNIAAVYGHQGRYDEALVLYLTALATYTKVRGKDHPEVART
jgi:hypothetical protein